MLGETILNRRNFIKGSGSALFGMASAGALLAATKEKRVVPEYERPIFNLHQFSKQPVKIASIELLRNGNRYFVRTRSTDGVEGVCQTKQIKDFVPIFKNLVVPAYLGKDARDLETLIDDFYIANYKMAGQSLWCPAAYVEQSLFDLLGKTVKKTAGELMGGVLRKEIPVYLSGSGRDTTAEEELAVYVRGVEETGTQAVKFKIGGRMSRNLDAYPGRTETLIRNARKQLGDDVVIYSDANGSYNAAKGIEVGKFLQDHGVAFFEEPCPWQEYSETRKVAEALEMPVAAGEQDNSLWGFQWMMETGVMDITQFDLNYNGGFVRGARVARMAREHGMTVVPHNTQTGATGVNILAFASATSNIGPHMEFPWRAPYQPQSYFSPQIQIERGVVKVPTGPGLGLEFDPDFLAKCEVV